MRKVALLVPLLAAAIVAVALLHTPHANAEDVLARALDASTNTTTEQIGDYTWLEDCGIGVQLPAAPATESYPRLLAGKRVDDSHSAALWELGPDGFSALKTKLEKDGATFGGSEAWPFRPRGYPEELSAHRSSVKMRAGKSAVVMDWTAAGRNYAAVVEDSSQTQASRRMDELLRELVQFSGVEQNAIAPLINQGRYACVLQGWARDGARFRQRTPQGWLSLRLFQVALTDFDNVGRLQFELENKLDAAGFKRSAGLKPMIAGSEGFIGEYFGSDGFVQRIAYVRLDGGYLVALMQGPEAQRTQLSNQMDRVAKSLAATGMDGGTDARPLLFGAVRNIRCLAWQDGRRVRWGILFDDGRQQPVLWRQEGIVWNIQLTSRGQMIKEREGTINSSRALNPLVDADLRELPLPEGFTGDVELLASVGGERTTTTITIK